MAEGNDHLIGTLVGPYQVVKLLGRGGMGRVYLARHEALAREAALKLILIGQAEPEDLRRFQREALLMARVSHPHVVRLYDCGMAHETPWIAMERNPRGPQRRPARDERRVLRGGCWRDGAARVRCAARDNIRLDRPRPFYGFVGFRCARSVEKG